MFKRFKSFKCSNVLFSCLTVVALAGCSSKPPLPSQDDQLEKLEQAMSSGAYKTARNFAVASQHDSWSQAGVELEVELLGPTTPGSYPLIIYLPSLGEDAKAGRIWRETWAKAGYVVFSMQSLPTSQALKALEAERKYDDPLEEPRDEETELADESMVARPEQESGSWFGEKPRKQSRTARDSELRYVGHQYFATDNLKKRLEQLYWAYQQIQVRVGLKQALFAQVDLSKVVVAGYDLGAQTVAALAGEKFDSALPHSDTLKPLAALVLSPSVDLAEGSLRSRFQNLNIPMLTITGTEDNDPYAISSASVRSAIWEHAPAGGKHLLMLQGAGHRLLAGNEMGGRFGLSYQRRLERSLGSLESSASSNRRRSLDGDGQFGGLFGSNSRIDPDLGYKQVAAIASVSTAFLDMQIKHDEFAQAWLGEKATKWLGKAGTLQKR